ncbi:hypothetical protein GCWU000321_00998 [Dialister invisus DSM 15470]|uniref:Uncharacterized protein n=1 Tax=Dialister invisus DSM 15470 TaxID=592028 RepID=C9LN79_9FIRM|nr:hypothetical protein GCWU000321_00998 [Dialister invisus DSM 15470]
MLRISFLIISFLLLSGLPPQSINPQYNKIFVSVNTIYFTTSQTRIKAFSKNIFLFMHHIFVLPP